MGKVLLTAKPLGELCQHRFNIAGGVALALQKVQHVAALQDGSHLGGAVHIDQHRAGYGAGFQHTDGHTAGCQQGVPGHRHSRTILAGGRLVTEEAGGLEACQGRRADRGKIAGKAAGADRDVSGGRHKLGSFKTHWLVSANCNPHKTAQHGERAALCGLWLQEIHCRGP